jgi:hypothetical protein
MINFVEEISKKIELIYTSQQTRPFYSYPKIIVMLCIFDDSCPSHMSIPTLAFNTPFVASVLLR